MLAPGGTLLLATDVDHEPTPMEPQTFGTEVLDRFVPPLEVVARHDLERHEGGLFATMHQNAPVRRGAARAPGRPGRPAQRRGALTPRAGTRAAPECPPRLGGVAQARRPSAAAAASGRRRARR